MFYRKSGTATGSGLENRRAMKNLVDGGTVPGLLGYYDGVPSAWVSVGPRTDFARLRRSPIMKPVDDQSAWSIVCFFVDPRVRQRRLSDRMLCAAVAYARSRGARVIEGYPVDTRERFAQDQLFFGTRSMYERGGFKEVSRRRPARPVMRKVFP